MQWYLWFEFVVAFFLPISSFTFTFINIDQLFRSVTSHEEININITLLFIYSTSTHVSAYVRSVNTVYSLSGRDKLWLVKMYVKQVSLPDGFAFSSNIAHLNIYSLDRKSLYNKWADVKEILFRESKHFDLTYVEILKCNSVYTSIRLAYPIGTKQYCYNLKEWISN